MCIEYSMRGIQLLSIEIGDVCNLASEHGSCPASVGDRWEGAQHDALGDDAIVDIVVEAHSRYGFNGIVCWHYYCEPTLYLPRIRSLIGRIREVVPSSRFGLWTNNTSDIDADDIKLFDRAWVTAYAGEPIKKNIGLISRVIPQTAILDARLFKAKQYSGPCLRPHIEMAIDYRGYVHTCCVAYKTCDALCNVQDIPFGEVVELFNVMRRALTRGQDAATPARCKQCATPMREPYQQETKVAALLCIRDELDMLPSWWAHYEPMVDYIIVTDNGSVDGTREWLADRERESNNVIIIDEPARDYQQGAWVTRMLMMAYELGCHWVLPTDTDELWVFPSGLRNLLSRYKSEKAVKLQSFEYYTTTDDRADEQDPVRRITYRAPQPNHDWDKVMVRALPSIIITLGNHYAVYADGKRVPEILLDTKDAFIRHYYSRSFAHYRRKVIQGGEMYELCAASAGHTPRTGWQWRDPFKMFARHGLPKLWLYWRETMCKLPAKLVFDPHHKDTPEPTTARVYEQLQDVKEKPIDAGLARIEMLKNRMRRAEPQPCRDMTIINSIAIATTAYMIPAARVKDWASWNDALFAKHGIKAYLVVDKLIEMDCGWLTQVVWPGEPFGHGRPFNLSRTSNLAIKAAIASGVVVVVKTDIDCCIPAQLIELAMHMPTGIANFPHYRMCATAGEALAPRCSAPLWRPTVGTSILSAVDWERICGYDERMAGYGIEDGDLYARAQKLGLAVSRDGYVAHVAHAGAGSFNVRGRNDQWNRATLNPVRHEANRKFIGTWDDTGWGSGR